MGLIYFLFCYGLSLVTIPSSSLSPSSFPYSMFIFPSPFSSLLVLASFFVFLFYDSVISACLISQPITLVSVCSTFEIAIILSSLVQSSTTMLEAGGPPCFCPVVLYPPPPPPRGEGGQNDGTTWYMTAVNRLVMPWLA